MKDLQLVPTDDLIQELSVRYHTFVFGGVKIRQQGSYLFTLRLTGDALLALGLCEKIKLNAGEIIDEEADEIDPEAV